MDDFILQSSDSDEDQGSSKENDHFEIHHDDIFSKSVDFTKSKAPVDDVKSKEESGHSMKLKKHPSFFNNVKQRGKMVTSKLIKTFSGDDGETKYQDGSDSSKSEPEEIARSKIMLDPDKIIQPIKFRKSTTSVVKKVPEEQLEP